MPTHRTAAALAVWAGLAGAASAQVNWTTQVQFAQTLGGPALPGNTLNVTATGTYTFIVRAGIFGMTGQGPGQANHGLFEGGSAASATGLAAGETLGLTLADARIAPYTFGPATSFAGTLGAGGTQITAIDCARDVSVGSTAPWLWDTNIGGPGPMPTEPPGGFPDLGVNSVVNVWRFTASVSTLAAPDIRITFAGWSSPFVAWPIFGSIPPTGPSSPGSVSFLGITPDPAQRPYAPTQLILTRIPAPPGAAALALTCLLAARRRRGPP